MTGDTRDITIVGAGPVGLSAALWAGMREASAQIFAEAAIAVAEPIHSFRPEMRIQPRYATNTGVPGAVEGQP